MECPHVDTIAHPWNTLAVGYDNQPRHVRDWVRWRVCPGEPLRIKQWNLAQLYRDRLMHIEDAVRDVREVYAERNRALIWLVDRQGNRRGQRHRLWAGR